MREIDDVSIALLENPGAASKKSFRIRGQAEKDMMKRQASANPNEMGQMIDNGKSKHD